MKLFTLMKLGVFSAIFSSCGCSTTSSLDKVAMNHRVDEIKRERNNFNEKVRLGSLPSDYKTQVDTALARILIDPDSRKVRFRSNPFGGLVCGNINSKNTFGGYTGNKMFIAVFNASQDLFGLQISGDGPPDTSNQAFNMGLLAFKCL